MQRRRTDPAPESGRKFHPILRLQNARPLTPEQSAYPRTARYSAGRVPPRACGTGSRVFQTSLAAICKKPAPAEGGRTLPSHRLAAFTTAISGQAASKLSTNWRRRRPPIRLLFSFQGYSSRSADRATASHTDPSLATDAVRYLSYDSSNRPSEFCGNYTQT